MNQDPTPEEKTTDPLEVQPAADIYAMGATLYRLLSGAFPHDIPPGRSPILVVLNDPIVPLRQRRVDLPTALVKVIERALAREPAARFASAEDMRLALLNTV